MIRCLTTRRGVLAFQLAAPLAAFLTMLGAAALLGGCTASNQPAPATVVTETAEGLACAQTIQAAVAGASDNVSKGIAAASAAKASPDCNGLEQTVVEQLQTALANGATVAKAN